MKATDLTHPEAKPVDGTRLIRIDVQKELNLGMPDIDLYRRIKLEIRNLWEKTTYHFQIWRC